MTTEPKDILKAERKRRQHRSAADGAKDLGIPEGTYRSYENGHRPITIDAAGVIQDKWGVDAKLLCPDAAIKLGIVGGTTATEARGDVAVGVWSDHQVVSEEEHEARRTIHVAKHGAKRKQSYRVMDESINKVLHKGWFAIVDPPHSSNPLDYPEGCFVVIERVLGNLTEKSIRRIEKKSADRCQLACFSTEKRYAGDRIHIPTASVNERISVIGVVVGGSFDL